MLFEYGITLKDLLDAMDEDQESVKMSLLRVAHLNEEQLIFIERKLKSSEINYLVFVLQTFYVLNEAGLYKNLIIIPKRDDVMRGRKATFEGLLAVSEALGISIE